MTEPLPVEPSRRHTGRWVAIGVGVGALVLLGGYGAAVASVSSQDVPAGTTVVGVDIGGMSREEAVATLERELGDAAEEPIPVTAGEASTTIEPAKAGLTVDWRATVAQSTGLILEPRELLAHLRGDVAVEPITRTDSDELAEQLDALAEVAAAEAVEPSITYTKKAAVEFTEGVPGTQLDVPAAADVVARAYFQLPYDTLALPMSAIAPTVSDEEAQRVLAEMAEPAVALPATLRITTKATAASSPAPSDAPSDEASPSDSASASAVASPTASQAAFSPAADEVGEVSIDPVDLAKVLTFAPKDGTLEPSLDGAKLRKALADELDPFERPGTDARIVIRKGKPAVVKSKAGTAVESDDLAASVLPVLGGLAEADRVAVVALTKSQPSFTTADAKALNIKEKLSSFRQWFPPAAYRYQNVGQAAEYLNGTILEPGETFSMNDTIHERTRANGYTEGYIISGGRFREELGGGVSIITTATWTAGFYAGLERVEQHPHGLYISRYKAGLEATVAYGLLDLRMRNDTGNGVLITATRYNDGVVIEMWGTKKFDKVTSSFTDRYGFTGYQTIKDDSEGCVDSEGVQGFSISVTRRRYVDGKVFSTETWPTHYKPTPNVVCSNPTVVS